MHTDAREGAIVIGIEAIAVVSEYLAKRAARTVENDATPSIGERKIEGAIGGSRSRTENRQRATDAFGRPRATDRLH